MAGSWIRWDVPRVAANSIVSAVIVSKCDVWRDEKNTRRSTREGGVLGVHLGTEFEMNTSVVLFICQSCTISGYQGYV